MSATKNY